MQHGQRSKCSDMISQHSAYKHAKLGGVYVKLNPYAHENKMQVTAAVCEGTPATDQLSVAIAKLFLDLQTVCLRAWQCLPLPGSAVLPRG